MLGRFSAESEISTEAAPTGPLFFLYLLRVPTNGALVGAPGGTINWSWLGRQDSNLGSRDQNPLPYHLATPQ